MSEKNIEEQRQEFYGELSGSKTGLYSGTMIAKQVKNEAETSKRQNKEKFQETYDTVLEICEKMYQDLMLQIDLELQKIHQAMQKNREDWDTRANRLEEIDDLFEAIKDGIPLNKIKAQQIIKSAGESIPENADNATYYTLLVAIKSDDLNHIEVLDTNFQNLEKKEQQYKIIKQKAENIANDNSLDENQKLEAYENLNNEMSKSHIVESTFDTGELELKAVSKNDFRQHSTGNSAYQFSDIKLEF